MASSKAQINFEFIVSTPFYNASEQQETQHFVRKHAMRPFRKSGRYSRPTILRGVTLTEYIAKRAREFDISDPQTPCASLISGQSQLPTLPFTTPPIKWRFYMPAFLNNWMTCFMPRMVSEIDNSLTSHQGIWLQAATGNAALFHATLALSAAYHHNLTADKLRQLALYHIGKAIVLVNHTISDKNIAVTDDLILTVIAIAAYENLQGDSSSCRVHLSGLQRLVDLRGGLNDLGYLARHALRWVDCSFSTATESRPLFPLPEPSPDFPAFHVAQVPSCISACNNPRLNVAFSRLQKLAEVLESSYTARVSQNEMWHFSTVRTHLEQELLLIPFATGYRQNDMPSTLDAVTECYRLGAILYTNLVLRCVPPESSIHISLSSRFAQSAGSLQGHFIYRRSQELKILLWATVLAGAVATETSTIGRLECILLELGAQLKVVSWEGCSRIMQEIVHVPRGFRDLCENFCVRTEKTRGFVHAV